VRAGRRIGVDVGDVRVGLASCDPSGLIATPLETVRRGEGDLAAIVGQVAELEALEVVVGMPRSLSGREGPAAAKAREYAGELVTALGERGHDVSVRLCDERLTTVTAEAQLREQGRRGAKRRKVVDQAAAVVILQNALDTERATGRPPGELVTSELGAGDG
jgi:putative Holliday junction resolvase